MRLCKGCRKTGLEKRHKLCSSCALDRKRARSNIKTKRRRERLLPILREKREYLRTMPPELLLRLVGYRVVETRIRLVDDKGNKAL